MIRVLVPSFRDKVLERLLASMEERQTGSTKQVLVLDNGLVGDLGVVERLRVPGDPFVAAQALNAGAAAYPADDILWLDDLSEVATDAWLTKLDRVVERWPREYGVLMLSQLGSTEKACGRFLEWYEVVPMAEVAMGAGVLIPRRVLDRVGPWDEGFVGYGFDDFDYGVRCYHQGLRLGTTGAVWLRNEAQAAAWVARLGSWQAVLDLQDVNFRIFHLKWFGAVPPKPWLPERPREHEHWLRELCACVRA